MSQEYTFDTVDNCSPCSALQLYRLIGSRSILCESYPFELFGVIVSLESWSNWIEFILDDSLQLTIFKCPRTDKHGMQTVLKLGDKVQVIGYPNFSRIAFMNAVKVTIHKDPNAESKYWLEQIKTYKCETRQGKVTTEKASILKPVSGLSFSSQVSLTANTCWKLWKNHFSGGEKVSLAELWKVVEMENSMKTTRYNESMRSQVMQLLNHLGYLIPVREKPETCILLTDDMLDKQVMNIFSHKFTSNALSLREVAYRLEQFFHVDKIRLERVEESILRLTYQEKVEQTF